MLKYIEIFAQTNANALNFSPKSNSPLTHFLYCYQIWENTEYLHIMFSIKTNEAQGFVRNHLNIFSNQKIFSSEKIFLKIKYTSICLVVFMNMLQKFYFLLLSHIFSTLEQIYNKQIPSQKPKTIKEY